LFACQNSTASLFIFSSPARADEWNQKVTITFANPVELPGEVSPAGTYVFEVGLGDTNDYDHFVRVYKESKDRLYGMFLTIPDYRLTRASKPIVEFAERPVGSPEAICAWSHTKDKTGHEFVYPRSEAMRLAQVNNRPVASMPDNTNSASESALKQRS
jgi:hypothetical protein